MLKRGQSRQRASSCISRLHQLCCIVVVACLDLLHRYVALGLLWRAHNPCVHCCLGVLLLLHRALWCRIGRRCCCRLRGKATGVGLLLLGRVWVAAWRPRCYSTTTTWVACRLLLLLMLLLLACGCVV